MAAVESALPWWACFSDSSSRPGGPNGQIGPPLSGRVMGRTKAEGCNKKAVSSLQHTVWLLIEKVNPVMFVLFKHPAILLMLEKGIFLLKRVRFVWWWRHLKGVVGRLEKYFKGSGSTYITDCPQQTGTSFNQVSLINFYRTTLTFADQVQHKGPMRNLDTPSLLRIDKRCTSNNLFI